MPKPLSVYIHWPFCKSKCPYCDFNSHVRDGVDQARWRAALLKELAYWAKKMPDRAVASIFFGGGTPSLMPPETVTALIEAIGQHWQMDKDVEITLEANPTSVEAANFKSLAAAGVNRASLGVQALNQPDLTFLGRHHSVGEAMAAVALAREYFPRMSFDLIYARPGQTLSAWENELKEALTHTKGHISLYQLTIEENTAFHTAYKKGEFVMPDEDTAADMYMLTQQITEAYGMPAYEVSNHARAGQESRHNLAYWQSGDVIGIGPGAHGRYSSGGKRVATETIKSPERWLEKVETLGTGLIAETEIDSRAHMEEAVMMGLRLREGIRFDDWQARAGIALQQVVSQRAVKKLQSRSLIIADGEHIRATAQGRLLLNSITRELLAG
jgi:oxygen-independent coproporphyrinogen-3 oxidase